MFFCCFFFFSFCHDMAISETHDICLVMPMQTVDPDQSGPAVTVWPGTAVFVTSRKHAYIILTPLNPTFI